LSLTGSLEDLPLLDILQIVSFSKKTGYLGIDTKDGDGAIVFDEGFVVASFAWNVPSLPPGFAALERQERDTQIRRRIEAALEQLIRLREGQFQFSLSERPPRTIGTRDIALETLEHGINPQELLLDLARGMDEDRRDSSEALEAGFAEAPAEPPAEPLAAAPPPAVAPPTEPPPEPAGRLPEHVSLAHLPSEYTVPLQAIPDSVLAKAAAAPAPAAAAKPEPAAPAGEIQALLLVDDEEDVRRILAQSFTQGGYQVVEAEDPEAAVKKAGRLSKAGISFVLVTDLAMPTSGGSSFQGGFEVVKRLGKMKLDPPVVMMTDSLSPAVRARAKQMGISRFVFKPSLSKLDAEQYEQDLRGFAQKLLTDLLPALCRTVQAQKPPSKRAAAAQAPTAHDAGARDLRVLQDHLQELRGSADMTRIAMLVMKVAREFFERGALFLVKNDEVRGLGGFGPGGAGESLSTIVRRVVIPLSEPSPFLDVISSGKPWHGALPDSRWSSYLIEQFGRFRSAKVALLPLIAHRDTIAILFGDNPETGRELGRLEALELFVQQAGIAMENTLLQRKLRSVHEKG
jgi:CheY-like chemotaxis protein